MQGSDTGPQLFLRRLQQFADFPAGVTICNPSIQDVERAKQARNVTCIARLDGTSYYRISGRNFVGLLEQRRPSWAKPLRLLTRVSGDAPGLTSAVNRYLDRGALWLLRNADGIVFQSVLSRAMHELFLGHASGRVPETVILNGVPLDVFSPVRPASRLPGWPALIISASIYRLHKRLQEAVRLVNRLADEFPDIRLHVLGSFDCLVQRAVAAIDTSRCTFHGRVAASKLPEYYGAADMQLSLSLFDPCPNVVCEGLASGLPVLSPVQSGAAELIGDENGEWLVDEPVPFGYHEFHVASLIPAIPLDDYVQRAVRVIDRLDEHKTRARARAEQSLDIRKVAHRYSEFARTVVAARD